MLELKSTTQFEKDLKRLQKQGNKKGIAKTKEIINQIQNGEKLDPKYKDHKLNATNGIKDGSRCCHILFDLLLVYIIEGNILVLEQLGDHHTLKGFKESLETQDKIKLITLQHKSVLDKLKNNETYIADYNNIHYGTEELYKNLSLMHNMKNCPIFCATEDSIDIIKSSNVDFYNDTVKLELLVPKNEIHKHQYSDWTDYLWKTQYTKNGYLLDKYSKELRDYATKEYKVVDLDESKDENDIEYCLLAVRNLSQYIRNEDIFDEDEVEIVLDYIKPEWLVIDKVNEKVYNKLTEEENEEKSYRIDYGYDRSYTSWVIIVFDENNNEVENEYVGNKQDRDYIINEFKNKYNTEDVKKIKAY